MLKIACRSRSKLATNSSESVFALCGCMMAMSFDQFATYEVLRCGLREVLPMENGRRLFQCAIKREA